MHINYTKCKNIFFQLLLQRVVYFEVLGVFRKNKFSSISSTLSIHADYSSEIQTL